LEKWRWTYKNGNISETVEDKSESYISAQLTLSSPSLSLLRKISDNTCVTL